MEGYRQIGATGRHCPKPSGGKYWARDEITSVQAITDTHVPAAAKPSTTATKRAASIVERVQAVGSMWITPNQRPKSR